MTTLIEPSRTSTEPTTAADTPAADRVGRPLWPLAGAGAGILALTSAMATLNQGLDDDDYRRGPEVLSKLDGGLYHLAFVLGLASVALLFVAAAGWKRWSEDRGGRSLAARIIPSALAATATVNIIGASIAGAVALYLPGGMDEGRFSAEGQYTNFAYLDFGMLFGWWATVVAASCVAVLALGRSRLLPRWMGPFSLLAMAPAVIFGALTALPGMPGLTMPIWLIVISIAMVFARTARVAD